MSKRKTIKSVEAERDAAQLETQLAGHAMVAAQQERDELKTVVDALRVQLDAVRRNAGQRQQAPIGQELQRLKKNRDHLLEVLKASGEDLRNALEKCESHENWAHGHWVAGGQAGTFFRNLACRIKSVIVRIDANLPKPPKPVEGFNAEVLEALWKQHENHPDGQTMRILASMDRFRGRSVTPKTVEQEFNDDHDEDDDDHDEDDDDPF